MRVFFLGLLTSCSGFFNSVVDTAEQCVEPPESVVVYGAEGYLTDCSATESTTCCAYGFLPRHDTLCFHIMCQVKAKCSEEWQYMQSGCVTPDEPKQEAKESNKWESEMCPNQRT